MNWQSNCAARAVLGDRAFHLPIATSLLSGGTKSIARPHVIVSRWGRDGPFTQYLRAVARLCRPNLARCSASPRCRHDRPPAGLASSGRNPHEQDVNGERSIATAQGTATLTELDYREAELQRLNEQLEQQNKLLKLKEEQLGTQYHQLDAALNNIVQGLAMFDAEHRLVLCNSRYAEIYHLTPAQVQPGTTLKQIIEHRMANGLKSEMSADDIVSGMLRRRDDTFGHLYSQLSDGRCLAITVRPMADGGTVTTHQDITDQRRSEAKIAHMAHHDALTGLPNRTLLNERLEQAFNDGPNAVKR